MENTERKFNLKTVMTILFWGALWGIVEATLGTLLHLPGFEETGLFFASSAVILPIAYCLMANCYKRTESWCSYPAQCRNPPAALLLGVAVQPLLGCCLTRP